MKKYRHGPYTFNHLRDHCYRCPPEWTFEDVVGYKLGKDGGAIFTTKDHRIVVSPVDWEMLTKGKDLTELIKLEY